MKIAELPWLAPSLEDVKCRRRALLEMDQPGVELIKLATSRLQPSDMAGLSKTVEKLIARNCDLTPLAPLKLGIVSNYTTDLTADILPAAALRHGIALSLVRTPFGQVAQQTLDPESLINTSSVDAVLIAVDHHWLNISQLNLNDDIEQLVGSAIDQVANAIEGIRAGCGAATIVHNIAQPPVALFGNYERRVSGAQRSLIEMFNQRLVDLCAESSSYLLDVAAIAESVGTDNWFHPVQWNAYKMAHGAEYDPLYADMLGRVLGAIRGKAKKCLVLDLDNTLWGGAIGDEGLDGIVLGQGNAMGEAFQEVQKTALALKERGIILAVCSKNNEDVAKSAFRDHSEMLLKESDIAVFQANWSDKASNLEAIAAALNIGVDALVLLDDNPAERAHVRAALPLVGVPELPEDPSWYPRILHAAGYFEATSFSQDDRNRAQSYAANAQRFDVQSRSRNIGDYLKSLKMELTASAFDDQGLQRITQLINKTNQFNLTTKRYTEAEIAAISQDSSYFTLQVRLEDTFSDLGMIAVVIASKDADSWSIDTWLMSCRVLGRKVEEGVLSVIAEYARKSEIKKLTGKYIPTKKNNMVADHYSKLGFELLEESADGVRLFALDVDQLSLEKLPMSINVKKQSMCHADLVGAEHAA